MIKQQYKFRNTCHLATDDIGMDIAWEYLITENTKPEEFGVFNDDKTVYYPIVLQPGIAHKVGLLAQGFESLFSDSGLRRHSYELIRSKNTLTVQFNPEHEAARHMMAEIETARLDYCISRVFIDAKRNIIMPVSLMQNSSIGQHESRDVLLLQNNDGFRAGDMQAFLKRNSLSHTKCTEVTNPHPNQLPKHTPKELETMFTLKFKGSPVALSNLVYALSDYAQGRLRNNELVKSITGKPSCKITETSIARPVLMLDAGLRAAS